MLETTTPSFCPASRIMPPFLGPQSSSPSAPSKGPKGTNTAATAGRWANSSAASDGHITTSPCPHYNSTTQCPDVPKWPSRGHEGSPGPICPKTMRTLWSGWKLGAKIKPWGCPAASHPDCTRCRAAPLPMTGDRSRWGCHPVHHPHARSHCQVCAGNTKRTLAHNEISSQGPRQQCTQPHLSAPLCPCLGQDGGGSAGRERRTCAQGTLGMLSTGQRAWLVVTLRMWSLPPTAAPPSHFLILYILAPFAPLSRS